MLSNFPKTVAQLDALDDYFASHNLPKINRRVLENSIPQNLDAKILDSFYAGHLQWLRDADQVTPSNVIAMWKALIEKSTSGNGVRAYYYQMQQQSEQNIASPNPSGQQVTHICSSIGAASLSVTLPAGAAVSAEMRTPNGITRFAATGPTLFVPKHPARKAVPVVPHTNTAAAETTHNSIAARAARIDAMLLRG
ncbi:MAG: hypothetical protein A2103_02460 [Gammaproteobacteria bacterium GWF2_41_13]|nr:MAG: hypothetical protein A2103_02460 [Gammaproteobacteria bacterium GWF2_41_13]